MPRHSPLLFGWRTRPFARALIAVALHRPGLWLLCGVEVSGHVRRHNAIAVCATAVLAAVATVLAPGGEKLRTALIAFAVGHLLWGLYLARAIHGR